MSEIIQPLVTKVSTFSEQENKWIGPYNIGAKAENVKLINGRDVESVLGDYTDDISIGSKVREGWVNNFNGRKGSVVGAAGDYDADLISYDNTTSQLQATDVQAAIDELNDKINQLQVMIQNL